MANTLKFKRGLVSTIPTAALGEPLFTTDTFDLYIGNGTGNTRFQKYIASGTTSQLLRGDGSLLTMPIVLTSPANGEVLKYNGTNWVNSSDAGVTGSGAAGQVTYWGSSSTITGSNNLFWDATNGRLGIGTNTPTTNLEVSGGFNVTDGTTTIRAVNSGGIGLFGTLTNHDLALRTNNTQRARITAGGNFIINNSSVDNGLRFQVTGDGYFSGSVNIGTTAFAGQNLVVLKNITGASTTYNIVSAGQIRSDVSVAHMYISQPSTQATAFTISNLYHFTASQSTIGATSIVNNQAGFFAQNTLTGATNNFGFFGDIASGTGRWNLYMNGTANNYLAGNLSIGTTTSNARLQIQATSNVEWTDTAILNGGANGDNSGTRIYIRPSTNFGAAIYGGRWSSTDRGARLVGISSGGAENSFIHLNGESSIITLGTATSVRATLDASGNLGLGVTPSAGSLWRQFEIGAAGASLTGRPSNTEIFLTQNAYHNNSNWIYKVNGTAAYFGIDAGDFRWYNAPSGTAAGTITFTERMRLFNATGNLTIGSTPTDAGFRADINGTMRVSGASTFNANVGIGGTPTAFASYNVLGINGTAGGMIELQTNGTSTGLLFSGTNLITLRASTSSAIRFETNGNNERMRITSAGDVGIGTSSPTAKLDVVGAATFSSSVTATSYNAMTQNIFSVGGTEGMRLTATNRNLHIGTFSSDSGEKLQVVGTAKIGTYSTTGYSLVVQNNGANDVSGIRISTGATVDGYLSLAYDATNTYGSIQAGDNNVFRNIVLNRQGGSVGIGANPNNSAVLQADSTTRGFLPPRMTTTQRNAIPTPAAGLVVYDTTTNKLCCYDGTTWNDLF